MHDTAFQAGSTFISTYASTERRIIVEIGAMDVNGTLRDACPPECLYVGIDVAHGPGVDIQIDPSKPLPLRSGFSNLTISTSQMEHDPRFWVTFLEMCRITAPSGLIYMSAPSNGAYHCHPVDVWRFYPDAGHALVRWARDNNYSISLLESFVMPRQQDCWNDFVAVFCVGDWPQTAAIDFIADRLGGYNVWKFGSSAIERRRSNTEDQDLLSASVAEKAGLQAEIDRLNSKVAELQADNNRLTSELAVPDESSGG